MFSILARLDPSVISQLSDALALLPDIAVVEAASDCVERRCCGQGCVRCSDTHEETD
jgi:hypothetical protein